MNKITLFLLLFAFSYSASAQESFTSLKDVKSLSSINKISSDSPVSENLESLNSENILSHVSFKNNISEKTADKPKKFSFSIVPYAWLQSVGGTVGYDAEGNKFGFNKTFSEAVKYLKMAVAFTGKFKYERVSFVYDISYINLKGFGTEVQNENAPHIESANWTAKQAMYDLFLTYLFPSKSKKTMVDMYGGGRLWNLESESTILDTAGGSTMSSYSNSWLDPVIGVNAEYLLSKDMKWAAWTKGDIGGFGVNSQMTWQLNAGVAYMLSKNIPTTLGFKYVGVNYDNDGRNWTVNEYGFTLGIGYRY